MNRRILMATLLGAWLLCPVSGKPLDVFVNGLKLDVKAVEDLGTAYYPVAPIAKALNAQVSFDGQTIMLSGRKVSTPPLIIGGEPYLSLDAMASAMSITVEKDPVRGAAYLKGSGLSSNSGIAHYSSGYRTPEEIERDRRRKMWEQNGFPGEAMLEEQEARMKSQFPKTISSLDRNKPPVDHNYSAHPWLATGPEETVGVPDGSPPPPSFAPPAPTFLHRSGDNGIYKLTVTDIKVADALRGRTPPAMAAAGQKFVVVFVTEENVSANPLRPAWFAVRDTQGGLHTADEALSEFSMGALRSRETTTGYFVCQIPQGAEPIAIDLICDPPLSISIP